MLKGEKKRERCRVREKKKAAVGAVEGGGDEGKEGSAPVKERGSPPPIKGGFFQLREGCKVKGGNNFVTERGGERVYGYSAEGKSSLPKRKKSWEKGFISLRRGKGERKKKSFVAAAHKSHFP